MNFNRAIHRFLSALLFILPVSLYHGCAESPEGRTDIASAGRLAGIKPDYNGITIPSNIAPLNFIINETGAAYFIRIHSRSGKAIEVHSTSGCMQIPVRDWHNLLAANSGQDLTIDVYVQDKDRRWTRFNSLLNHIAAEPMDGYLVYRKFLTLFNLWKKMGIYQRNLANFDEKPVLLNQQTLNNCMNCHNFWQNGTDQWLLHLRAEPGVAMLLSLNGEIRTVKTATKINPPAAYPSWHPSGKLIAFSASNLLQFFHSSGECRDVLDRKSDIIVYDIASNTITTAPQIASPDRMEIWPAWSPDGKYLYFCSAARLETYVNPADSNDFAYDQIKYDLMRVAYDPAGQTWGAVETVIAAADIGLTINEPRISPDGRYLLFTAAGYGQFPNYLTSADLYLLDLHSGKWKKSEANSDLADTFHSWSSNGRWFVFSSKRQDGLFTRPFFSYLDTSGVAAKPFVLPQENPLAEESALQVYNVPEFTTTAIRETPQALARAAFAGTKTLVPNLDPRVDPGAAGKDRPKSITPETKLPGTKPN